MLDPNVAPGLRKSCSQDSIVRPWIVDVHPTNGLRHTTGLGTARGRGCHPSSCPGNQRGSIWPRHRRPSASTSCGRHSRTTRRVRLNERPGWHALLDPVAPRAVGRSRHHRRWLQAAGKRRCWPTGFVDGCPCGGWYSPGPMPDTRAHDAGWLACAGPLRTTPASRRVPAPHRGETRGCARRPAHFQRSVQ